MEVKPFRAFRFNTDMVGDVGACISPPYDVIDAALQQQLYEKSPYNIVRITKGRTSPSDNPGNNQYTRAAECFDAWLKKGVLKQDSVETIYAYVQDFEVAGTGYQRLSFIALSRLEEFGKTVRPHEQTLDEPIIDRLSLKRATAAGFGLPFLLYEDKQQIADKIIEKTAEQAPLIDFPDEQTVRHRLFAITAADDIKAITKMMRAKSCIIADGHHRYITALTYSKENKNPAAQYLMAAFANICHEGLLVLATHRLVGGLEDFRPEDLISRLKKNFEVTEYQFDCPAGKLAAKRKMLAQMKAQMDSGKNVFGFYTGGAAFYTAVLKDPAAMDSAAPKMSRSWRCLDVSVLHKLIFEGLLGIGDKQLAGGGNIEYVKDTSDAIDRSIAAVDGGGKQAVFFMNPPKIEQIRMVTDEGERMPQKSTYFYPKIYTGLTINKF
jgi:uncharacterized protein (DUF1015 family)